MRFSGLVVSALVSLALASFAAPAAACSPPLPGLSASVPGDGGSLASNGQILFFGYQVSLGSVGVTVDGTPAVLVETEAPPGLGALAARIEPAPAEGQIVQLIGDFCTPELMCDSKIIVLFAEAPDNEAPEDPASGSFDVYDYVDFETSGGDCQSSSDLGYFLHLLAKPAKTGEGALVLTVDVLDDAASTTPLLTKSQIATTFNVDVTLRVNTELLGGKPPESAFCFRVSASDMAGNAAANSEVFCDPCRVRVDPAGEAPFSPPDEPEWTADDVYAMGPCYDPAAETTGAGSASSGGQNDATEVGDGCGCRAAGLGDSSDSSDRSALFLFGLAALGLAASRRRAR